jgi:G:T-mismatch repair DNA endonuclease (very short patch repair protein)
MKKIKIIRDRKGRFVKGVPSFIKGKTWEQFYGNEKAKEMRERVRKSKIGITAWNKGLTKETDERVRRYAKKKRGIKRPDMKKLIPLLRKGKSFEEIVGKEKAEKWKKSYSKSRKKSWQNIKYRNRQVKLALRGLQVKPNKPEKIMMQIIKENKFPFNYVGDGKIIIDGFNPDFLSKNPKHIIEVFGDYWHRRKEAIERDKQKLRVYTSLGYKTLIVWEYELKEPQKVAEKIRRFMR